VILVLAAIWGCSSINEMPGTFTIVTSTSYGPVSGQPETGNKFIAIKLEVESRVDNFEDFNSSYARLQDKDGNIYFRILAGKEPWLPAQHELVKGSIVTGWITFEVPDSVHELWLIYQSFQRPDNKPIIIDLTK